MNRHFLAAVATSTIVPCASLAQDVIDLREIVVTPYAGSTAIDRVGVSVDVIDQDDLEATKEVELSDYLRRLPGISLSESGGPGTVANMSIRGAGGEYISIYVDGILVTDPTSTEQSFDNFSGLSTSNIRRIEILRGSQSALYGGTAVGGVINISTLADENTPDGISQTAELFAGSDASFGASYGLTHKVDALTLSLGLSHQQGKGISAADENNGNPEKDAYDQTRLSFGAEYDVTPELTLGVSGFAEKGKAEFDDFGIASPVDGTTDDTSEREAVGIRAYSKIRRGDWDHDMSVSAYRIKRTVDTNGAVSTFEGRRNTFDWVSSYAPSDDLSLSFGADLRKETSIAASQLGGRNSVTTKGVFAEGRWALTPNLDVMATVRHDDHEIFGGYTTNRVAFAYRVGGGTKLRGAFGTGYRAPSLDELYGNYPGAFPFVGNPALKPETSVSYEVGVDHDFANGSRLSATLFQVEIDNLITYQFGVPSSTLVNVPGQSTRKGLELATQIPLSDRVKLTGAYTYTEALNATGGRLTNVPKHDLAIGLDAELTDRMGMTLSLQHIADRANGAFDPQPYTDYSLVNTTFTHDVADGMEAYLRIENLFDIEYQTQSGYGAPDRTILVGLRAEF